MAEGSRSTGIEVRPGHLQLKDAEGQDVKSQGSSGGGIDFFFEDAGLGAKFADSIKKTDE